MSPVAGERAGSFAWILFNIMHSASVAEGMFWLSRCVGKYALMLINGYWLISAHFLIDNENDFCRPVSPPDVVNGYSPISFAMWAQLFVPN